MTDDEMVERVARAWNKWWSSVSTGANDKHMQTAFEAGFAAAIEASGLQAENAALRAELEAAYIARDGAGWLGTSLAETITNLSFENAALRARVVELEIAGHCLEPQLRKAINPRIGVRQPRAELAGPAEVFFAALNKEQQP